MTSEHCQLMLDDVTIFRHLAVECTFLYSLHPTPNITRSSDSFSTVQPIVNGGDWGCIVRDLETIIVLVLLAVNFIPQRSHHSLTLPRSRIRDSTTATLTPSWGWHNSHQSGVTSITDQLILQNGKKLRSVPKEQ